MNGGWSSESFQVRTVLLMVAQQLRPTFGNSRRCWSMADATLATP
jgi:hypothetical protein